MYFHDYGFDLTTLLKGGLDQINTWVNPPPKTTVVGGGPAATALPVYVAPVSAPLTTIAGIAITPAKLAIGLAAVAGVIYFARRKRKG